MIRTIGREHVTNSIAAIAPEAYPRYRDVSVEVGSIKVESLLTAVPLIQKPRYTAAVALARRFLGDGVELWLPAAAIGDSNEPKVLLGPIVEGIQGGWLIIDGMHRVLAAWREFGRSSLYCCVLRSRHFISPPGPVIGLEEVRFARNRGENKPLFVGKGNPLFRPGEVLVELVSNDIITRHNGEFE